MGDNWVDIGPRPTCLLIVSSVKPNYDPHLITPDQNLVSSVQVMLSGQVIITPPHSVYRW